VKAEFVNPFIQAATEVLETELGGQTERGELRLQKSSCTTHEVTALVGVSGQVRGLVLFAMSQEMALSIASRMMACEFQEFDAVAQSGIGELGNVITGRAGVLLSKAGYSSTIHPPALLVGKGTKITTLELHRLVLPLRTDVGELEIQMLLKPAA
jgi:chemotaxis protein CheX